jgi:hypothetical protein
MFDLIGILYDPPAEEDGAFTPIEGWHVNTTPECLALHPGLEPFVVQPGTLRRVWAGDSPDNPVLTVALQFADETEAVANLPVG